MDIRDAWEKEYSSKQNIWSGKPASLPDLPVGTRVLELGCGNGKTLSGMVGKGWDVTAVDISPSAVSLCKDLGFKVLEADARDLPFEDGSFDAVLAYHIIGHCLQEDRKKIAEEITRVLSPEGKLFFRDFGIKDMRRGKGEELEPDSFLRGSGILTHYFRKEEVVVLFPGLEKITIELEQWEQSAGNQKVQRAEVIAEFIKRDP